MLGTVWKLQLCCQWGAWDLDNSAMEHRLQTAIASQSATGGLNNYLLIPFSFNRRFDKLPAHSFFFQPAVQ